MPRERRVLIVADDLTGAMDSAGPFAGIGVETWVVAAPMQCDSVTIARARVVSVNTDSRHLPAAQAATRVRDIVRRLDPGAFDVVVKKIDSTLRGNVVAETLALLEISGRRGAIIAPAFPAQGRTVKNGVIHVNGVPLAETAFASDALSPPPLAPLQRVFAEAQPGLDVVNAGAADDFSSGSNIRIWIADGATDADLAATVGTVQGRLGELLLAGSAGITKPLARACFGAAVSQAAPEKLTGTIVFAVGSRAVQSAEQVESLMQESGTRMLRAPNGRLVQKEFPAARNLVLKATADDSGVEGDAQQVAADIARNAIDAARRTHAQALVATGGDTAIAILTVTGNPALQVLGELMPGIPYARIRVDGAPLWLVTKAGGFGGRDTFRQIARRLRAETTLSTLLGTRG
ncbi:MAG TPA: four-carbon acid sugar kinase family protein [Burkholderiales bacterium]|nr:four-carbon acid sugar kinase family protein [Burkholderiales bacterium]